MTGFYGGQDLCNRIWRSQTRLTSVVGLSQQKSNAVAFPAGTQPGDLALFYGVVNTDIDATGFSSRSIAAGPTPGWTTMAGAAQFSTAPFASKAIWWKKLTAADIAAGAAYTLGTNVLAAACGVMVFRGATAFALVSSGATPANQTSVNSALPAKPANIKLMIFLLCLRADLAEVITQTPGYVNVYPGVMFAGAFFFCDPTTYTGLAGTLGHWSWTTASSGFLHNISAS